MRARTLSRLLGFFTAPGFCSEFIDVYLAEDLTDDSLPQDEDESIDVDRVSLADALALIQSGQICDAKSVSGILTYAARLAS